MYTKRRNCEKQDERDGKGGSRDQKLADQYERARSDPLELNLIGARGE